MRRKIQLLFLILIFLFVTRYNSEQNKTSSSVEKTYHALKMFPVSQGFGVNIYFYEGNKKDLSMLKKADVGIVRMDVSWSGIEKSKGQYNFSRHDKLINDLEELRIKTLFIIDYGNPLYDDGLAPHSEEGRNAYTKFCSELTERYTRRFI